MKPEGERPSRETGEATEGEFRFQPLAEDDLPLLLDWRSRPHVTEWSPKYASLEELRARYLPRISGENTTTPYLVFRGDEAIAYVQSYVAADVGDGWWPDESDPGTLGTDQFLAHEADLGRGLGTRMVCEFLEVLFQDPTVHRIQVDPAPDNTRAIRCYEKVGFHGTTTLMTPDGPARLMVLERSTYRRRHTPPKGTE